MSTVEPNGSTYLLVVACRAGFAAQSLLAALGSIQFVSNVIFAYFVLHEQVIGPDPHRNCYVFARTCPTVPCCRPAKVRKSSAAGVGGQEPDGGMR